VCLIKVVILWWCRSRILLPSSLVCVISRTLVPPPVVELVLLTLALLLSFQHLHLLSILSILLLEIGDVAHLLFVSIYQLLPLCLGVFNDLLILNEIFRAVVSVLSQMLKYLSLLRSVKLIKNLFHNLDGSFICRKLSNCPPQNLLRLSILQFSLAILGLERWGRDSESFVQINRSLKRRLWNDFAAREAALIIFIKINFKIIIM